jgi:hypothetical protein
MCSNSIIAVKVRKQRAVKIDMKAVKYVHSSFPIYSNSLSGHRRIEEGPYLSDVLELHRQSELLIADC